MSGPADDSRGTSNSSVLPADRARLYRNKRGTEETNISFSMKISEVSGDKRCER